MQAFIKTKYWIHIEITKFVVSIFKYFIMLEWNLIRFTFPYVRLQDHIENVEKTRQSLDQQTEEVRLAMEEKLSSANALRDENIKKMLERLKEHVSIKSSSSFHYDV